MILKVLSVENTDITLSATEWTADEAGPADAVFSLIDMEADNSLITSLFYKYKIENGEVTITDCDLDISGDVIIPDTIEGYPVTVIGENAFSGCDKITSIVVPDSVKVIEQFAFSGSDGLLSATIGTGVITLGQNIFWSCKNLETVVIKEGVTYISPEMFSQCWKLKSVSIPESVTSIGESAFEFCYLLKNIEIPENVSEIDSTAFYHCENLESINIPEKVTVINSNTFSGCKELSNIQLHNNITKIGSYAFSGCKKLSNIQINNNITEIGSYAFSGCAIKEINIPDGIKEISEGVFSGCSYLSEITIPESVNTIGMYAFFGCTSLKNITVPSSVENIYYKSLGFVDEMHRVNEFYLYGFEGSVAESYAKENIITFIALCKHETTVVKNTANATCTADGYTGDAHCEACDELLTKGEVTPALGHKEEVVPEVPATYTETGLTEGKKCSVCNEILVAQEVIPMLEMPSLTPSTENITVTDTFANLTPEMSVEDIINGVENENVQILDKDGEELAKDVFVGTGAKINILDKDGKVLSTYEVMVKSDVDGNGKITPADARLALRASAKLDKIEGVFETAANYDGKDTVSTSDARMILRKAAGLE